MNKKDHFQKQEYEKQGYLNDSLDAVDMRNKINNLQQTIQQKDIALNQWMKMCEDLSQNLLQKQIDMKQMEINLNSDDEDYEVDQIQSSETNRDQNSQQVFYENKNNRKFSSNKNEDIIENSRCRDSESTMIGTYQTFNTNQKENIISNYSSPLSELKKKYDSLQPQQGYIDDQQFQASQMKEGNISFDGQNAKVIHEKNLKQIEQVENEANNVLNELKKQIVVDKSNQNNKHTKQIKNDINILKFERNDQKYDINELLNESNKIKQYLLEINKEKEELIQQNNQFFRIINEKCLEIQHLQGLLIQRDQNVIDYSQNRNEEYKQFLKTNNDLINENKEQRDMIFRFQQQFAVLNYLKTENQEINNLKKEKQNLITKQERLFKEIQNLKLINQQQSEYKLQYIELKADYEILAKHIQELGKEYIADSINQNICPTCYTQDQNRLIIAQLQQKISHQENKYNQDITNLLEEINKFKIDYIKENKQ